MANVKTNPTTAPKRRGRPRKQAAAPAAPGTPVGTIGGVNTWSDGNGITYGMVPIAQIDIDPAYHTPNRKRRLTKLDNAWDLNLLSPLLVNYRDNVFYAVDGYFRVKEAKKRGFTDILCIITDGLSLQDEAKLFATQTDANNLVTPLERFDAEFVYGEKRTLDIEALCKQRGYCIGHKGDVSGTKIHVITTMWRIYAKHGLECLDWALTLLNSVQWFTKNHATDATFFYSFANVWHIHTKNNTLKAAEKNLRAALTRLHPMYLKYFAKVFMPTEDVRSSMKPVMNMIANGDLTYADIVTSLGNAGIPMDD